MEMMYSEASSHANIDEYGVSDKNISPKTKKERIIENVQETSAKAVVLNNRDIIRRQLNIILPEPTITTEHVNIVNNEEIVEKKNKIRSKGRERPKNLSPNSRYASQAAIQTSSNCYDAVIAPTTANLKILKLLG
ncbi:hypothetical protein C1646_749276 [Rhizophagus diaphanus]|nr:hypothetical protein C1646_749276 [Rhizophagus diaphanus] [Rhizophagus sp. MUCL 43196]